MQHRADVERARRAADADPVAFELLFADTIDRIYAWALGRAPDVATAERVSERALECAFRNLHRYDGSVSLAAWVLAIAKRELRGDASVSRRPEPASEASSRFGTAG